ncbi:hypothetical protein HET69_18500 [Streptomyces sp. CJ_13]|uniref:hypothetical protein n=1 Tax=Streptomyces TaxID=1883 RepID=UPI000F3A956A|nr:MULTISPECIES: hypothetical protein [unclassified Streptomyces]AYV32773.1 hypothetical protein EES41_39065 [Streptomyces sp. ADI95-16]MBT1185937.1 hypothetical protein [Streptomyces sp. CJ_13]
MNEKEHRKPTPPSEAPGESGDRAARREADDAVIPASDDDGAADAPSPDTDARRRTAKRDARNAKRSE